MNRFDDLLPEEIEPQHKELITLLQHAYSRPVLIPPAEQAQIIARVLARLPQTDHGDAFNRDMPLPQIGVLDSSPHQAVSPVGKPRRDKRPYRLMALLAAAMLIVVLLSTSLLLLRPRLSSTGGSSAPALMLSPNVVDVYHGPQQVQVHLVHFLAGHRVQLSHDVQEEVTTVGGSPIISIGADGSANATILVTSDWVIGFDQVYAEDIATRYTASAQLQVMGSGPSRPAHLMLSASTLNFGTGIKGSDTILPLTLMNSGSGSITWSASSNQPWLLVSPVQGTFSQSQSIEVAAQRVNLPPGTYAGAITISSNVGAPQTLSVTVQVTGLPSNVGPVVALNPAVLSFTTTDGSPAPPAQLLTLNNPGTQPLNWSLTASSSAAASNQLVQAHMLGASGNWVSADQMSGSVPAGSSQKISVSVNSSSLLPGTYLGDLVFIAPGAADTPQTVGVSLTVQQHCGIVTTAGNLSFTAVEGKTNPSNQSLGLNATASCAGAPISWKAAPSPSSPSGWLSATPLAGTLAGTSSEFISVGANATGLPPGPYNGFLALSTQKSTQTVMVTLTVQPPPLPGAPVMAAAPLNLNFSNTQGQPNPRGQVVTITNNGGSPLKWNTNVTAIACAWLVNPSPTGGIVPPNQSEQLVINVDTSCLSSPGTYAGQIILNGMDNTGKTASGSPQIVSINLVVQPPCTLTQPSSSSLALSGVQGPYDPISQNVLITGTGNCSWPLVWTASVPTNAPWLVILPPSNSIKGSGQSSSFTVSALVAEVGLTAGVYSTKFTISATDSAGTVAIGSPQTISVTLTVLPPCLTVVPAPLTFTAAQGQASPAPQSITLSETGTCSRPVNWVATTTTTWLSLSTPAPDTGNGSLLTVTVNSAGLPAGANTGTISVSATDSTGQVIGPARTITVTVNV